MGILEAMENRHSVRRYTDKKLMKTQKMNY